MIHFTEENSDFYDQEYYIGLEYRYLSGAFASRVENILKILGDIKGKKILDIGCGGGYLSNEFCKRGAKEVVGMDYAAFGIHFAKERYPEIDFRIGSVEDLSSFEDSSFDVVTFIDTIEHVSRQDEAIASIKRVLKRSGKLLVATDVDDCIWQKPVFFKLIKISHLFSKSGRAYRLIKKVEAQRRNTKNYHETHIAELSVEQLESLLMRNNFKVIKHSVYPMVGVSLRDIFLKLLPKNYRGDHQSFLVENIK